MSGEAPITLAGTEGLQLEARLAAGSNRQLVVLCHPHPQFCGIMNDHVDIAARNELSALGYSTVRFNFRGVGDSEGHHGGGEPESADLEAILTDLQAHELAADGLALTGYSFGSWVASKAAHTVELRWLALLSPPIDLLPFHLSSWPAPHGLLVTGDCDPFCPQESLDRWLDKLEPAGPKPIIRVLERCDHFYGGHEHSLRRAIAESLNAF